MAETPDELEGLNIQWLTNGHRSVNISAAKVRELRREIGLTQRGLAVKAGFSEKFPQKVEAEDGPHRLNTILKLARALGVAPRELQAGPSG